MLPQIYIGAPIDVSETEGNLPVNTQNNCPALLHSEKYHTQTSAQCSSYSNSMKCKQILTVCCDDCCSLETPSSGQWVTPSLMQQGVGTGVWAFPLHQTPAQGPLRASKEHQSCPLWATSYYSPSIVQDLQSVVNKAIEKGANCPSVCLSPAVRLLFSRGRLLQHLFSGTPMAGLSPYLVSPFLNCLASF